jgi:hypothetical protein
LVFSPGNGNPIGVSDVDAGSGLMRISLAVTHGTLTLSGSNGLTFSTGDGLADPAMVFTGTLANINAALAGMFFTPTANYNGSASIQITSDDQGNSGSGGRCGYRQRQHYRQPGRRPPVASARYYAALQNGTLTIRASGGSLTTTISTAIRCWRTWSAGRRTSLGINADGSFTTQPQSC